MDTQEIIGWLNSDEGLAWAWDWFDDASDCHEIIEIYDDYPLYEDEDPTLSGWYSDAGTISNAKAFRRLRAFAPEWRDLKWTPDQPPEGGTWTKKRKQRTPSSSTVSPSK